MNTIKAPKGLFGAVLLLCAILCVTITSVTMKTVAAAGDDAHTHPICGATYTDVGDHTGECAPVTYTAWNGITDITYTDDTAYIYLTDGSTDGEDTFYVTNSAPPISPVSSEPSISTKVHSIALWSSISLICLILLIILIALIVFLLSSLKKHKQKNNENK